MDVNRAMLPLLLLLLQLQTVRSYKILVYNIKFGHSHTSFMGHIADVLAEEGHNVTSLCPAIYEVIPAGTKLSKIINVEPAALVVRDREQVLGENFDVFRMSHQDLHAIYENAHILGPIFGNQCDKTVNVPGLLEELQKEHYDVVITETFDACGVGIAHAVKPKAIITVSSTGIFDQHTQDLGLPLVPSYVYGSQSPIFNFRSIWGRFKNLVYSHAYMYFFGQNEQYCKKVFKEKYGKQFPSFADIKASSAFVFTNTDPLLDFARPTLRKIIDVGGLTLKKAKPLDDKWDKILSRRSTNVLLSFGSVARSTSMPSEMKENIIRTFARFPDVTFIWKFENPNDTFAAEATNIVLHPWLPQNDLLNDGRVTVFITHCGMASCLEAAYAGVPLLIVPLFADQPRNAAMMQENGLGRTFEKDDLADPKLLYEALKDVLENKKYKRAAKRLSALLPERPLAPRDLLVKHVEFAAEFGSLDIQIPKGRELSFIQYYLIDVIVLSTFCIILFAVILALIVFIVTRKVRGKCKTA